MTESTISVELAGSHYIPSLITFSAGELHPRLELPERLGDIQSYTVKASIKDASGVMFLALVSEILKRRFSCGTSTLQLDYLPYSRQDRACANGDAFSLKVFADILNAMGYDEVVTLDAHNPVVAASLIKNLANIPMQDLCFEMFGQFRARLNGVLSEPGLLVSPDKGAAHKLRALASLLGTDRLIVADKKRNPVDGHIVGMEVSPITDMADQTAVICDDICDGGRTFIELAKILKQAHGVGKVILYVTHGIYSKGFEELNQWIDEHYCYNYIGKPQAIPTNLYQRGF